MSIEATISLLVRLIMGAGISVALAAGGYFVGWSFLSAETSLDVTLVILTFSTGVGAGLGAFVGWIRLDETRPLAVNGAIACLAVAGGLAGAWGGSELAGRGVAPESSRVSMMLLAAVPANALPLLAGLLQTVLRRNS